MQFQSPVGILHRHRLSERIRLPRLPLHLGNSEYLRNASANHYISKNFLPKHGVQSSAHPTLRTLFNNKRYEQEL